MEDQQSTGQRAALAFLDLGRTGRASPWRYLLGIVIVAVFGLVLSAIPMLLVLVGALVTGLVASIDPNTLETGNRPVDFAAMMMTFPLMWLGVFLAVRLVHRRPFRSVVTAGPTLRWRRIAFGAAAWMALPVALTALDLLQNPSLYRVTFEPRTWFVLAALGLVLVPIQTTAEELQCRGYLLQAAGRLTRRPWLALLPSTILFTLLHAGNPEFQVDPRIAWVQYFVFGLAMAAVTLRDGGMELALGAHAANNLFGFLLVDQVGTVGGYGAILTYLQPPDPTAGAIGSIVTAAAFWMLLFVLPDLLRRLRSSGGLRGLAPTPREVLARRLRASA